MRPSAIQAEIQQGKPFRSTAQEGAIALLRTASVVGRGIARALEPFGLSLSQYNALRIIRGAGEEGITTLAIRERMIEEGTPITRVLDRLEESGYIRRERGADRRQVVCRLTATGEELLGRMDPIANTADEEAMAALSFDELETLIALLDAIRLDNSDRAAPRTMLRRQPAGATEP
jgi:DNA-binding MarR family transcriptional regulator